MSVVVTVPKGRWDEWISEGDLPDEPESDYESHFLISSWNLPRIRRGDPVYIVAHGKLRGYAPLVRMEIDCQFDSSRSCLVRCGGAVAVTIPEPIRGFQGWRYRWWSPLEEVPFPDWRQP